MGVTRGTKGRGSSRWATRQRGQQRRTEAAQVRRTSSGPGETATNFRLQRRQKLSEEQLDELRAQHHRALKGLIENEEGKTLEEQTLRWLIRFAEIELSALSDQDWTALYDQLEYLLRGPVSVRGFGPRFLNWVPDAPARQQIADAQSQVSDCLRSLLQRRPYECVIPNGAWVFGVCTETKMTAELAALEARRQARGLAAAESRPRVGDELALVEQHIERQRATRREGLKRGTLIRRFSGALPAALVDLVGRSLEVTGVHRLRACQDPSCGGRIFLAAARGQQKYCRPEEGERARWQRWQQKHGASRRKTGRSKPYRPRPELA